MNLSQLKNIYFIGIGGIGMSALARFFAQRGAAVSGYDRAETELTKKLQTEGLSIHFTDDLNQLDKAAELVVYTPAIPQDNKELNWYRDNGYAVYKRSDVLQWITESMQAVTVAGTHGKTTISTLIAYLLREMGYGCNAFLGGISSNYNSNYWSDINSNIAVIEADEYDRSLLKLHPEIGLLTAMDADHLDIYKTEEALEEAYIAYTKNIKPGGTLIMKHGLKRSKDLSADNVITYSLQNSAADAFAQDVMQKDGGYYFNYFGPGGLIQNIHLPLGGMHNVENTVAAIAAVQVLGAGANEIKAALAGFKGVRRRFEYVVKSEKQVYIDDYAHHPEELSSLIRSAKRLFNGKKCVIAFQPHLYSRTADFAEAFAHSLDEADEVILLDIYPAREQPMEGITSATIADKMNNPAHTILSKDGLLDYVRAARPALFITAGAGDIDKLVQPIKEILQNS